jgi:hypothetical protein
VPRKACPVVCCMTCIVRPNNSKKNLEIHLDFRAKRCLKNQSLLPGVQICTVWPCIENGTTLTQKNVLEFVPSFSLGNVPSKMLTFLSQSYSENLSPTTPLVFSMCLEHYPMHSFINLKMTFSLQSIFSPSPALNPKAKIRSFLFQDQGSLSIPSKMNHLKY